MIGVSTHTPAEVTTAMEAGADFIVFGPVYWTPSKARFGAPRGLEDLARVSARAAVPVLAIGGINAERVQEVRLAGASGVAVLSAIMSAQDPAGAARGLLAAMRG